MTGGAPLLLLVCLVVFLDSVGYGIVVPLLPLYARTLRATDFQIGLLFAVYAIALLLASIPFGILSDRFGRKPFVLFGMFAMAGTFVFYALSGTYPTLVLARLLDGLTAAATWSAALALLGDRLPESEMGEKTGYALAAMAAGGIVGPLLGGFLADAAGQRAPFYAIALACFAGGTVALFLEEDRGGRRARVSPRRMLGNALSSRNVLLACGVTLVVTTGLGLLEPTVPLYLKRTFSMSRTGIGAVFGLTMLFYAAASPAVGRLSDRAGRKAPILAGMVLTAALIPLLAAVRNVAFVFAVMGALGVTFTLVATPSVPLITDSISRSGDGPVHYGTAFGLLNVFWSLGYAVGPLLGGALMGWAGLPSALFAYAVMLMGFAALVAVTLKEGDGGRQAPWCGERDSNPHAR